MMAPSLETSCRGNLPVAPSTPVRAVTNLLYRAQRCAEAKDAEAQDTDSKVDNSSPCPPQRCSHTESHPKNPFSSPIREAVNILCTSSASFIVSSSPIQSTSQPPLFTAHEISPQKPKYAHLLAQTPLTGRERELQEALKDVNMINLSHKKQLITMQSSLVLNGVYVDLVRHQLQAQEEAKKNK